MTKKAKNPIKPPMASAGSSRESIDATLENTATAGPAASGGPGGGCLWPGDDELMVAYHDTEWGVPVHDERRLFEHIVLDGAQAGLSWRTILHKRQGYRRAFADFDIQKVARFTEADVERLMRDASIVRNRRKIESAISNARVTLTIVERHGTLDAYLWSFVGGKPIVNQRRKMGDIPATSPESDAMSKQMKKDGFKFVGSTICYAFMQAAGLVNDHLITCPRHAACAGFHGSSA